MQAHLKRTPLYQLHQELGGRMVAFGGWEMPVQYIGVIDEHLATRTRAGLFDVSHMGEIEIRGRAALPCVQYLLTNDASKLAIGQIQYSALCYENGTFIDDLLVYRLAGDRFMLCVNASNTDKDVAWIMQHAAQFNVTVNDMSAETAMLSVQGPQALPILQRLTETALGNIRYYHFTNSKLHLADGPDVSVLISRTGYTGENGVEVMLVPEQAEAVARQLLSAGQADGLQPVGLGARDTLRLEAKMALSGNDIGEEVTPLEADLAWIVSFEKGDFVGREALIEQQCDGLTRKLVGFEMTGKGIARHEYPIIKTGREIGHVTSGSYAPYLKKNIGLGYVPVSLSEVGTQFDIRIRKRDVAAQVVPTPFYQRRQ